MVAHSNWNSSAPLYGLIWEIRAKDPWRYQAHGCEMRLPHGKHVARHSIGSRGLPRPVEHYLRPTNAVTPKPKDLALDRFQLPCRTHALMFAKRAGVMSHLSSCALVFSPLLPTHALANRSTCRAPRRSTDKTPLDFPCVSATFSPTRPVTLQQISLNWNACCGYNFNSLAA